MPEQHVQEREEFIFADAARQHEREEIDVVERKLAEDITNLSGVDVALLQFRKGGFVEVGAVRTGG